MKNKKLLAGVLCAAMVMTSFAACGKEETSGETTPTPTPTEAASDDKTPDPTPTNAPVVQAEELPTPKYYFSFDEKDGVDGIQATGQFKSEEQILQPVDKKITFIPGVKGDSIYVDGSYGLKLDVNGVGDVYTVSYWMYATRFANYMPTLQFGPDVHGDATGNQHYLNITRSEWNPDGPSFPCIWAYDQAADGLWPNWAPEEADEHLKQWLNITLVVDPSKTSIDGTCILADLYVNGELFNNGTEIKVVTGTMSPSDNFDFLLGVNYWDAIFKGAFDEVYVFDQALTAGQVQALYQAGDATVAFAEPERIIEVKKDPKAIESIGAMDYSNELGSEYTSAIKIADGETMKIQLHNWSDGKDSKNNYAMAFTKEESEAALADAFAVIYADADGKGDDAFKADYTYSWGNWNTWCSKAMVDVTATITVERSGNKLYIKADNVDYNTSSNLMTADVETSLTAEDDCYLYFTCGKCYMDLLSVKNATVKTTGTIVGFTDCTTPFWNQFSDIWAVPAGSSKTINFTNFTSGAENWHNFVAILQNTPTGHSAADAEGYSEYAVVRADNWGWGPGYEGIAEATCDWNWDTFKEDMDGAKIALTVTNNGSTADVVFTATTTNGAVYNQAYKNIAVDGDVYLTLTMECAYIVFEPTIVGFTDCTTPFWNQFSDIWAVPAGGSTNVKFTNHTSGAENWHNFAAILQSTPTGHSAADAEGYAEYAVVRADNWGWGPGYEGIAEATCDWNWDTFKEDMEGAKIDLTVTNNGSTADVVFTATTTDGRVFNQAYRNIAVDGDVYLTFTMECAYLMFE